MTAHTCRIGGLANEVTERVGEKGEGEREGERKSRERERERGRYKKMINKKGPTITHPRATLDTYRHWLASGW